MRRIKLPLAASSSLSYNTTGCLLGGSSQDLQVFRITSICKPWKGHLEGVPQPYLGDSLTMAINHLLDGMILQDPPSRVKYAIDFQPTVAG